MAHSRENGSELPSGYLGVTPMLLGKGPHPSIAVAQERYQVNYFRSRSMGAIQSATVISITNHSRESCNVDVTWLSLFSAVDCTQPTVPIGADQTQQFCSRAIDPSITFCLQSCTLEDNEGRVEVALRNTVSPECLNNLTLDSRVYFINVQTQGTVTTSEVTGIYSPKITLVPFGINDPLATGISSGSGNKGD